MTDAPRDPFELLYERIAEDNAHKVENQSGRKPVLRFRASEAGSCKRQVWYRLMGYKPRPDPVYLTLYQVEGNVAQDVVRALFEKYGVPLEGITFDNSTGEQVETLDTQRVFDVEMADGSTEQVTVSARADGFFPSTPRGPAQFEFKTMSTFKMKWLQDALQKGGEERAIARVKEKHGNNYPQVQITMAVFDDELAVYGAKDRNLCQYGLRAVKTRKGQPECPPAGLYIPRDQEAIDHYLRQFALVKRAVKVGEPPKPQYLDGSTECNQCAFYEHCPTLSAKKQRRKDV